MWFSIWSSLIVITDEGRNPETGWLRSYLVYILFIYIYVYYLCIILMYYLRIIRIFTFFKFVTFQVAFGL